MIKLRKPFSQKVQLHIRQDMLQRLWDKYVPTSSPEYGKIELIYLKGMAEEMEKQPERIQLLLHLILKNKMLQMNLTQCPALMKLGQKQMGSSLRRVERYYTVQLKSAAPAMYHTVNKYFTLLEQAREEDKRYQNWQKTNLAIEKQKEEYHLLSLFSEKLRERLTESSVHTLRTMQRDFVNSLSEPEYQMLAEELIWQEKPELITYFNEWNEIQCENIVRELEQDSDTDSDSDSDKEAFDIKKVLEHVPGQFMKEKLITAVERLEQREFCLFYHQLADLEAVDPQIVLWKESRAEMLHAIDQMESVTLQQLQKQVESMISLRIPETGSHDPNPLQIPETGSHDQNPLQIPEDGSPDQEMLRTLERELVYSLSETEYQTLSEKNIWQEKPGLIAYFRECEQVQCTKIVRELEKDVHDLHIRQILSLYAEQPARERLIATAKQLEQKEFCLFYHHVMQLEDIDPQIVLWKESRTEMLAFIDRMESRALQQVWEQIEHAEHQVEDDALRAYEKEVHDQETLRTQEKELLQSLLETEYQTLAEQWIWQEKPELIAYFRACEKAQCKEIIRQLEKDTHMRQVLATIQKQSAKKKLVAAAYKLEPREFSLFYWQVANLMNVNPQIVIWKKSREEMLRSIDLLRTETLQKVWEQMNAVEPVRGIRQVFTEKMLHIQNQYQQNTGRDFQEQIATVLEENGFESVADTIDIEQLMQSGDTVRSAEETAVDTDDPESAFGESGQLVLWDKAYQVMQNLEHEREIRRERIEQQQIQAAMTYQEVYHRIFRTAGSIVQQEQQESTAHAAERIFRTQHQEQLTTEEIRNIYEWSQAFLEVYLAQQGQAVTDKEFPQESSFLSGQREQSELLHVIRQMDQYMEEQHGDGERPILRWQDGLPKDERIQKLLIYIRELEEENRDKWIHYLADMVQLSVQLSFQREVSTELPIQSDEHKTAKRQLLREDREFAGILLQAEDRELAEKLLQEEDREFARRLLQVEDREFARELLQIEDREFAKELMQNNDRPLLDVSYRSLWEWGETLLFYPEYQQEDADILPNVLPVSDGTQQEDIQTQVIRRQIEMAKDRNRLQSLIRQLNHQADVQLVYTDAQLRLPKVQTLLQYVQQLDEHQYGMLVNQLAHITEMQKRLSVVHTEGENSLSSTGEVSTTILHDRVESARQPIQNNAKESAGRTLRTEDSAFIKKLLQVEDREFAMRLLQVDNMDFAERLLQIEDREFVEKLLQTGDSAFAEQLLQTGDSAFVEKLLQVEDREFAKLLLRTEDSAFIEKLLQIENRAFAKRLLQIENRELAERLLQIEDREFAERLLRVGDSAFIEKLLQNSDRILQNVSYRDLWEWGEALLLHPEYLSEQKDADRISSLQRETSSSDDVQQEDEQTQVMRQKNHLQSLIRQLNHQADIQLMYTDTQLKMPQIQTLLQHIRQLDVGQYGVFVKELAKVTMIEKMSYEEPATAAYRREESYLPDTRSFTPEQLGQESLSYPILVQNIQHYAKQRQAELYKDIRLAAQKIFPQAYRKVYRQPYEAYDSEDSSALYDTGDNQYTLAPYSGRGFIYGSLVPDEGSESIYGLMAYEAGGSEDNLASHEEADPVYARKATYVKNHREAQYQTRELEYSVQTAPTSEEEQQKKELRMQQETAQIKSVQRQLDKKLKEVEDQLKKVESTTKEKEDVRTFAEQVKRQLYEELHVEKLRRGLI